MKKAMAKLDMMVIVDPYPTVASVMNDRKDGVYLLPATTQFETRGSVTASNRSLQWRDQVIEPLFDSKPDHTIMYLLSKKLGFADQLFKHISVQNDEPNIEDITREFNRGMWTIGYTARALNVSKRTNRTGIHSIKPHSKQKVGQSVVKLTVCPGLAGERQK